MPISINGSGTISGISVGGLENGCVNEADLATAAVTNTKLASNAVTIDKMGSGEQSGLCKAWVNFNGTGTVAIRASYNVSSITDNGTGDYTVNFTTALVDANYSVVATGGNDLIAATDPVRGLLTRSLVTTSCRIIATRTDSVAGDTPINSVAIFR
jgi:hypothetical protein